MAKPRMTLPIKMLDKLLNNVGITANIVMTSVKIIVNLLPNLDAIEPPNKAPKAAPTATLAVTRPTLKFFSSFVHFN